MRLRWCFLLLSFVLGFSCPAKAQSPRLRASAVDPDKTTVRRGLIRVALFNDAGVAGQGVPMVTKFLGQTSDVRITQLKGPDIAAGGLKNFDVVMFTGGSASKQGGALGEQGRAEVQKFVRNGGGYIGICAGAYLACTGDGWRLGLLNARTVSPKWQRGRGEVEMEVVKGGEEFTGLAPGMCTVLYANGPIIQHHDRFDLPRFKPVAVFRSELAKNDTPNGIMVNSPAIVCATFGKGRVLTSSPHPEQTPGLEAFVETAVRWAVRPDPGRTAALPYRGTLQNVIRSR